ncbi:hypothetical protein B296_00022431, partial [Ensete ventricosum]
TAVHTRVRAGTRPRPPVNPTSSRVTRQPSIRPSPHPIFNISRSPLPTPALKPPEKRSPPPTVSDPITLLLHAASKASFADSSLVIIMLSTMARMRSNYVRLLH